MRGKRGFSAFIILLFLVNLFHSGAFAKEIYWSAEKKAVYSPLLPYTLEWSGNVMKSGGYDFDGGTITTNSSTADIVMNAYGHAGARKISRLTAFKQAIDKETYKFQTDGFGSPLKSMTMAEGDVYLIEASDGKFAQIRIDQMLANAVHFTYIVESEKAVEEPPLQFDQWALKETTDPMKEWNITFSNPVDTRTINAANIYVKDTKGNVMPTKLRMSDRNTKVHIAPYTAYQSSETYTLYISQAVKSGSDTALKKGIMMPFKLKQQELALDWNSGLTIVSESSSPEILYFTWSARNEPNIAGYYVYLRLKGKEEYFSRLNQLLPTNEVEIKIKYEQVMGEQIEAYITVVYKDGKESAPSNIQTYFVEEVNEPIDEQYARFFGSWNLHLLYIPFGTITINEDGTYYWEGGPEGTNEGMWEIRNYGFTLVNANQGKDLVVEPNRTGYGIKLSTVTNGRYTDGSPIIIYYVESY